MALRRLRRGEWREYCDRLSKSLVSNRAELEVVSLALGDHLATQWARLFGITYDARSQAIEVALEGFDHMIADPADVCVEETSRGVVALQITAADGTQQIVRLREPVPLADV
jgi:hypothetical protein